MSRAKKGTCPGHEVFVRAFLKEFTAGETERLVTHVMSCPPCWEKFQAMRRVRTEMLALETAPEAKTPSWSLSLRLATVLGSALLLLVGFALFVKLDRTPAYRGSAPDSGGVVMLEPSDGVLNAAPPVLRCTLVEGADGYRFKLIDEDLRTIVVTDSDKPRIELNDETRAKLVTGKIYLCTVTVTDDESRVIGMSSKSFELR